MRVRYGIAVVDTSKNLMVYFEEMSHLPSKDDFIKLKDDLTDIDVFAGQDVSKFEYRHPTEEELSEINRRTNLRL